MQRGAQPETLPVAEVVAGAVVPAPLPVLLARPGMCVGVRAWCACVRTRVCARKAATLPGRALRGAEDRGAGQGAGRGMERKRGGEEETSGEEKTSGEEEISGGAARGFGFEG